MYSLTQNDDSHRGCTTALTEDVFVNYQASTANNTEDEQKTNDRRKEKKRIRERNGKTVCLFCF